MLLIIIALIAVAVGGAFLIWALTPAPCRHDRAYWVKAGALTQDQKAQHQQGKLYAIPNDSRWCPDCSTWLDLNRRRTDETR